MRANRKDGRREGGASGERSRLWGSKDLSVGQLYACEEETGLGRSEEGEP